MKRILFSGNGATVTKRLIALLSAATMLCMTACGKTENSGSEATKPTDASTTTEATTTGDIKTFEGEIKEDTLVTPTTETTETTTEANSNKTEATKPAPDSTSSSLTADLTAIKEIAEKGYDAAIKKDYDKMVKYVDLDVMWYMAKGEWITDKALVAELEKVSEGTEVGISTDGSFSITNDFEQLEDLKFTDVKECTAEELKEINDFIKTLGEESETSFSLDITKAYKLPVTYSNMSEEEKALFGTADAPCMYVIEYNGKLKLDFYITLLMELYNAFSQMGAELGSTGE